MYFSKKAIVVALLLYNIISVCNAQPEHPNWKLIDRKQCGKGSSEYSSFFSDGRNAEMGKYPWMALIGRQYILSPKIVKFYCGGSLINKNYVLTAAHCILSGRILKTSVVRLGEHNVNTVKDCEDDGCAPPVQDFAPEKMIVHNKFKRRSWLNDIALIRLDRPAKFNNMVYPICLPHHGIKENVGTVLRVAGWGRNSNKNILARPIILRETSVTIVRFIRCKVRYASFIPFRQCQMRGQMCATGSLGRDACNGDSGGPLMLEENVNGDYKYFVKGIISFGDKKCGSKSPGVYTNVFHYVNWILDNIKE